MARVRAPLRFLSFFCDSFTEAFPVCPSYLWPRNKLLRYVVNHTGWPRVSPEAAARWRPGLPPEKDGPGLRDRPPNPLALVVEAGAGPPVGGPSSPPRGSLQEAGVSSQY